MDQPRFLARCQQINKPTNEQVRGFLASICGAVWAFEYAKANFSSISPVQRLFHGLNSVGYPDQWLLEVSSSQRSQLFNAKAYIAVTLFVNDINKLDPDRIAAASKCLELPANMVQSIGLTTLASKVATDKSVPQKELVAGFKKLKQASYINLAHINLREINLQHCVLNGVNFHEADFYKVILGSTKLRYANLTASRLQEVQCWETDFSKANLTGAKFIKSTFLDPIFKEATITNIGFEDCKHCEHIESNEPFFQ
jgi:uncharacterized protein YjbI with pentapeptide repeats